MRSIRRTLIFTLLSAFTLVMFVASLNGYLSSMNKAEGLLDDHLKQLAVALAQSHSVSSAVSEDYVLEFEDLQGPSEIAYQIIELGRVTRRTSNAPTGSWGDMAPGFSYRNFGDFRWRVYALEVSQTKRVVVAERADVRFVVAETVVLQSIYPLLVWLPLLAVITWFIVTWGLRPLAHLSLWIGLKKDNDFTPIALEQTPKELKQIIQSLNDLLGRLGSAFQREKQFGAVAAHELRTPISVAKVHIHNLRLSLKEEANLKALDYVDESVGRLQRVVQQMLDLSRTQPEVIQTRFDPIDLNAVVQQVCVELWSKFDQKSQSIEFHGAETLPKIIGDGALLGLLFENLLQNANRYTPKGGQVWVETQLLSAGEVTVTVSDSGPGIAKDQRDMVFNRFYRVHHDNQPEGVGLGLAIVGQIARLHRAHIDISSNRLGGANFRVTFPASENLQ
ncbi:MAG: ATP-binding protein [Halieaceae bacterium]|nr:ATP-binding protein [Halieaceae bacterium]